MLKFKKLNHLTLRRLLSTSNNVVEHLKDRALIRVAGAEVSSFLQGLITNDIEHLSSGPGSMYTMFLNSRGRILYDTIIYRNSEKDAYLIECDSKASETLQKHLRLYRVRRKIDIASVADELEIHAVFDCSVVHEHDKLQEPVPQAAYEAHRDLLLYRDPRIPHLGSRIIAKSGADVRNQLGEIGGVAQSPGSKNYRWLRYCLGVGEGVSELPPEESFPLECNCDYLHGVSFHKGCYVGQELTARVHHTGVVRKRLMPIRFTRKPSTAPDHKIVHENVNLGKFRGMENDAGLGLLRFAKALAFKEIRFGDGVGTTFKPNWWPAEAPKEKINVSKI